jgi:hypothetical protein
MISQEKTVFLLKALQRNTEMTFASCTVSGRCYIVFQLFGGQSSKVRGSHYKAPSAVIRNRTQHAQSGHLVWLLKRRLCQCSPVACLAYRKFISSFADLSSVHQLLFSCLATRRILKAYCLFVGYLGTASWLRAGRLGSAPGKGKKIYYSP